MRHRRPRPVWWKRLLPATTTLATQEETMHHPSPTPSPLSVSCPNCQAAPGFPCTQPTSVGRTTVRWFHLVRETNAVLSLIDKESS